MRRLWIVAACASATLFAVSSAHANDLSAISSLTNTEFANLSTDLGNALSYHDMMPAAPLGLTGVDAGINGSGTPLSYPGAWKSATGSSQSVVPAVGLQVQKGLPLNFGVGLVYNVLPGTSARAIGGDISYAISSGGLISPALVVRGTYTRMTGVSEMQLSTRSLEVAVSKGFAFVTPYLGYGRVRTSASANGVPLAPVTRTENKIYGGVDFNLALFNVDVEADHMSGSTYYGAHIGVRF